MTTRGIPDGLPVLSRGKHRSPRQGACFMEMASVLANEPWSDRPRCTHPLLAQLARWSTTTPPTPGAPGSSSMIPEVVGVHGHGLQWEVALVAAVAAQAVYDVPEPEQRALAAGLLRCDELAERYDVAAVDRAAIHAALDRVPGATRWAQSFMTGSAPIKPKAFQRQSAPAVLLCSSAGPRTRLSSTRTPAARPAACRHRDDADGAGRTRLSRSAAAPRRRTLTGGAAVRRRPRRTAPSATGAGCRRAPRPRRGWRRSAGGCGRGRS